MSQRLLINIWNCVDKYFLKLNYLVNFDWNMGIFKIDITRMENWGVSLIVSPKRQIIE